MANLVIGQTGFIGSAIFSSLEDSIPFKPSSWELNNFEQEIKKIRDSNNLNVFWAAGKSNNSSSRLEVEKEIELINLFLKLLLVYNITVSKFNYISSAGSIYSGCSDEYINSDTKESPLSDYGKSRLEIENSLKIYCSSNNIKLNIFRLTNVFGFKHKLKLNSGVINNLIDANINQIPVNIFVSLFVKQDYIDIDFVKNNIYNIALNNLKYANNLSNTYIFSRNYSHSIQEIISTINRITNKKTPYVMQYDPNAELRNSILNFKVDNRNFIKFKINSLEFQIRKLISEMIYAKIS